MKPSSLIIPIATLAAVLFPLLAQGTPLGWQSPESAARDEFAAGVVMGFNPVEDPVEPLGGGITPFSMPISYADHVTPEISAMARGLRHDAWSIYRYCFDRITHECYWGSKKGATLTMLEESGNCFDTASLMVALLKASGYEDVEYRYGLRYVYERDLEDWLGILSPLSESGAPYPDKTNAQLVERFPWLAGTTITDELRFEIWKADFLTKRGYPWLKRFSSGDYLIPHVWVRFKDKDSGATVREMDPTIKYLDKYMEAMIVPSSTNLGYTRTTFLSGAGGTSGLSGRRISGLNITGSNGINERLSTYTTNLVNWLNTNHLAASTDDFIYRGYPFASSGTIGGHTLLPGYDYTTSSSYPISATTWTQIPAMWELKLNFRFGNGEYDEGDGEFTTDLGDVTIPTNRLMGRKISLTSVDNVMNLRLAEGTGEDLLKSVTLTDATVKMRMAVDHPIGLYTEGGTFVPDTYNDQSIIGTYKKSNDSGYAILYGFDSSPTHLRLSQERLDAYRKQGKTDSDWEVRTENLNIVGLNYLSQVNRASRIAATRTEVLDLQAHQLGRVCQENAVYIDVGLGVSNARSYSGREDTQQNFFHVSSYFASALEHGVLEQLAGPNVSALSTVRMIRLANDQGLNLYLADSSNWSSIESTLDDTGNGWPQWALDGIGTKLTSTSTKALIPQKGNIGMTAPPAAGAWRGYAWILNSATESGYFIQGGYAPDVYSGGHLSGDGSLNSYLMAYYAKNEPGYYMALMSGAAHDALTLQTKFFGADPVDMASGAFVTSNTDLEAGLSIPRGLAFQRSYNSNRSNDNSSGIGYGWTHNLDIRASRRSAVRAGWGDTTPAQMAPAYVAIAVALDVFANRAANNAKDYAVTALVSEWGINQLRENAVAVSIGAASSEFVKLPSGAYVAPAGSTATLTAGTGGTFAMQERHGNTLNFNSSGFITSIVDPNANSADFGYTNITVGGETRTVLETVEDQYGRTLTLTWTEGRITKVKEDAGALDREVNFGYTGENLTSYLDAEGDVTTYGYATNGKMDLLTDGRSRPITRNFYDEQGQVYQQHLHDDSSKLYKLYFSGYLNVEEDPEGGLTTYVYDRNARVTDKIDATGVRSSSVYDGQNRTVEALAPGNNGSGSNRRPSKFTHNADHNVTNVLLPKRSATDSAGPYNASRIYDAQKRLWKEYDFSGNFTEYTYTTAHQIHVIKDKKGQVVQTNTYNTDGTISTVTDGANKVTKYLDYSFGYPGTIEYPAVMVDGVLVVPTETLVFNARGDLEQHTDRNGNVTTYTYNSRRQPRITTFATVDGVAHTREIQYDDAGVAYRFKDENGNWTATDTSPTGKLLTTTLPSTAAGRPVLENQYDKRDWLEWSADAFGRKADFGYDLAGRNISVSDQLDRLSQSLYDTTTGQLSQTIDPRNKNTFLRRNWRGELYQTENSLTHTATDVFDKNGNRDTFTNKRGKLFDFGYDANDRLTSLKTPLLRETTSDWTSRGLLSWVREHSGDRVDFTYDDMGRLTESVFKQSSATVATVTRGLDRHGNIKKITEVTPGGTKEVSFPIYDARNRVRSFVDLRSDTIGYRYDGSGNLIELIYPNSKGSVLYTYDSHNRLQTITDWSNRVTRFHYDLGGRITRIERPNGTERRYAWDAAGQMRGVSEIASDGTPIYYSVNRHDDAGRRDQEIVSPAPNSYTPAAFAADYDDDNRLTSFGGSATTNDLDGNLTHGPLGSSTTSFGYDSRNRLISAGGLTYTYDPMGNRVSVTDGIGETKWTIDPNAASSRALVREKGGQKTWYVYGQGLAYEVNAADEIVTYHYDARGSTVALSAGNGTTILDRFNYDPFGVETWRQASFDTPFRYHGFYGIQTDSNGLCHMRARYYHPKIRRFLNADPIGFEGGTNWYLFAEGNPVQYIDPSGNAVETVWDIANVGIGAYSLGSNIQQGNWGWAAVDLLGLAYDATATAVPFLPAGASAGLKASRAGNTVVDSYQAGRDVARISDEVHDLARAIPDGANPATAGTRLHRQTHAEIADEIRYFNVDYMPGANRATGQQSDLIGNNIWGDITTPGQWNAHVTKYGHQGEGIAILYERGVGVVQTTRLSSGAGLGLTTLKGGVMIGKNLR